MARSRPTSKFGIGEWYGKSFVLLTPEERKQYAEMQGTQASHQQLCPFQTTTKHPVYCNKTGGVCSLRIYHKDATGQITALVPPQGRLRCTCPNRFKQDNLIYKWVASKIIGTETPHILKEISFLESTIVPEDGVEVDQAEAVGMIDNILVAPGTDPLRWCALEIQAVYFSGAAMGKDYSVIRSHEGDTLPFPGGNRRPDYRSSGPKRLMPQLQIKVPSLRRWGKKMAVIVDEDFFRNMGPMATVGDVSNCDVVWFVIGFDEQADGVQLVLRSICMTTLEHAVDGLTGGIPVSLGIFEDRIRSKLT